MAEFFLGPIVRDIISVFLPDLCLLCDAPLEGKGEYLCPRCWASLPIFPDRSGQPLRPLRGVLHRLWIGWTYDDNLRQVIHLFKYYSRPELAQRLVREWLRAVPRPEAPGEADLLVPVPIHPARRRLRGFNQSERLAQNLASRYNLALDCDNAVRVVNTPSQTLLGRGERWRSVEGAFQVCNGEVFRGRSILIMDDLVTSGATLHSLARLLLDSGASRVSAAVLTSPTSEGQAI